ncbi:LCP family protein [Microbacterium sediminis]|uniref:Transcriptional regulator n=1 Tax=Microbacterium sediminis TaxID=904291 RepID=A0A1B9NBF2_9MICO|nr:LCP family protein [Microbacterium sediminis]OCG73916.1 transcriptional regulator [Microbacterium sediminis]
MSVTSPPRVRSAPASGILNARPLRNPDAQSPQVMTRRGWWLVILGWLIPGSAQVLAGNRRLGRIGIASTLVLWAVAILGVLGVLLWRAGTITVLTFPFVSLIGGIALIAYGVLWVLLAIDTLRLVRLVKTSSPSRYLIALVSILTMVLTGSVVAYGAPRMFAARSGIGQVFQFGPPIPPSDGYYNILLLGADSGEGRDSMRFDSISVVSINADTGAVTITGIPRDMPHFPFADGPMQELYPDGHYGVSDPVCGWSSGINQLRTEVELCRADENLYPDAESHGSTPGVEATKDAAEGILGIEIPYYVFIDMDGFAALIDALGGVDIEVTERLPKGWGPAYEGQPVDEWAVGWIEPGLQHMDGDTAQWYARSRYTTNDWDRMERQRQLQAAILAQFTPQNVLDRFQQILGAGDHLVQTDIPQAMLGPFVDLAVKAREQPFASIELTPEGGVDPEEPDYGQIRDMIQSALHPPTPTATPAP